MHQQHPAAGSRSLTALDARKFGNIGSGTRDDRPALQTALDALVAQGGGWLHLPAKTFLFETTTDGFSDRILRLNNPGRDPISVGISADPGAVFTTPLHRDRAGSQLTLLSFSGPFEDCVIDGLAFTNTHVLTAGVTSAIMAAGGPDNRIKRLSVVRCPFRNHSRALHISGVEGLTVFDNKFLYTKGRDSGNTTAGDPNVSIWCFVDSGGQTSDVRLIGNYFDGCTSGSVAGNVTPTGLDGFVAGAARGWYIAGNVIKRNGFEGIYVSHRENSASDRGIQYPAVITANSIDGTPPVGSAGLSTWGIRSDEQSTIVLGNTVKGATHGILVSGQGLLKMLEGVRCGDNVIEMPVPSRASTYGIAIQAAVAPTVHDNLVYWSDRPIVGSQTQGMQLFHCPNADVHNNAVRAARSPESGNLYGFFVQQTYGAHFRHNAAASCSVGIYEHQHSTGAPGNRFFRTRFTDCATSYGGDDVANIIVEEFVEPVSSNRWQSGDSDVILGSTDLTVQRFDSPRTADRTITIADFPATAAANGRYFDLIFSGPGGFQITVRDSGLRVLKVIPGNTPAVVRVQQDAGGRWRLTGYQLL